MSEVTSGFESLRTIIPENENENSGSCLRDALSQAGIDTDLPDWPDVQQLPEICSILGLELYQGKGSEHGLPRKGKYILGHIVDRSKPLRLGHFTYTDDIETTLQNVDQSDLFAIIRIPKQKSR